MITQTSFYRGAGVLLCTRNHHWNIYTDAAFKEISIQMQKRKKEKKKSCQTCPMLWSLDHLGDNHCQEDGWAKSAWRDTRAFEGIGLFVLSSLLPSPWYITSL
jgi:hypothetical protein